MASLQELLLTLSRSSYTPNVIMMEPQRILVQSSASQSKGDWSDCRPSYGQDKTEQRTKLNLLCDDGSFMASQEMTNFWLTPTLQPPILPSPHQVSRKESVTKETCGSTTPTLTTNFFENCSAMNDVEFGGNDLLHVYNSVQLKHRINTSGPLHCLYQTIGIFCRS